MAGFVNKYLDRHPSIGVIISGVGVRGRHPGIQKERIKRATQPLIKKDTHNWLQAALVNAGLGGKGR